MTVKNFNDLPGFKNENLAELKAMGITTVSELAEALNDEGKIKEIIKNLSGVGPKTAEKWKDAIGTPEESAAEEKAEESKVVESGEQSGYMVKAKPVLSDETVDALAVRAIISGRRPAFKRQEWFRYAKLGDSWRRPKGIHSKMKRNLKRRPPGGRHRVPRTRIGQGPAPLRIPGSARL